MLEHVTIHWYQVVAVGDAETPAKLPPKLVHGPVEEGPDCHWYETPEPDVVFCSDKLTDEPKQTFAADATVLPGVGVPVHAAPPVMVN